MARDDTQGPEYGREHEAEVRANIERGKNRSAAVEKNDWRPKVDVVALELGALARSGFTIDGLRDRGVDAVYLAHPDDREVRVTLMGRKPGGEDPEWPNEGASAPAERPPLGKIRVLDEDPWKHRSQGMRCSSCAWYVPKAADQDDPRSRPEIGRCRRHAPTMNGYPVVFPSDWCGDHKLCENKV